MARGITLRREKEKKYNEPLLIFISSSISRGSLAACFYINYLMEEMCLSFRMLNNLRVDEALSCIIRANTKRKNYLARLVSYTFNSTY